MKPRYIDLWWPNSTAKWSFRCHRKLCFLLALFLSYNSSRSADSMTSFFDLWTVCSCHVVIREGNIMSTIFRAYGPSVVTDLVPKIWCFMSHDLQVDLLTSTLSVCCTTSTRKCYHRIFVASLYWKDRQMTEERSETCDAAFCGKWSRNNDGAIINDLKWWLHQRCRAIVADLKCDGVLRRRWTT